MFGDLAYSDISESEDVPQDLNTTSYLAGVYGGQVFGSDVRLSFCSATSTARTRSAATMRT